MGRDIKEKMMDFLAYFFALVFFLVLFGIMPLFLWHVMPPNYEKGDCLEDTFYREKWEKDPRTKIKILEVGKYNYRYLRYPQKTEDTLSFNLIERSYDKTSCPD